MQIYTSVFVAIVVALLIASLFMVGFRLLSSLARTLRPYDPPHPSKRLPFECGNEPEEPVRKRFHVKFYVIALLFVLFDVEVVFMYPLAVVYRRLGMFGFVELAAFLLVLVVGYVYVWRKGALAWN